MFHKFFYERLQATASVNKETKLSGNNINFPFQILSPFDVAFRSKLLSPLIEMIIATWSMVKTRSIVVRSQQLFTGVLINNRSMFLKFLRKSLQQNLEYLFDSHTS